jgi:hypothetical protein
MSNFSLPLRALGRINDLIIALLTTSLVVTVLFLVGGLS